MEDEIEDPIAEQMAKSARTLLMAAGVAAEQIARARRETAERAEAAHGAEADQLRARWDAERALAIVEVTSADGDWFGRATSQQAGAVWQTAHAWEQVDSSFVSQAERIRAEIEARYGLDIATLDATGGDLSDELRAQEQLSQTTTGERASEVSADALAADGVLLTAGRDYDTDRRRGVMGERARAAGVEDSVVGGRVLAANAYARPLSEATLATDRARTGRYVRPSPRNRDSELGR